MYKIEDAYLIVNCAYWQDAATSVLLKRYSSAISATIIIAPDHDGIIEVDLSFEDDKLNFHLLVETINEDETNMLHKVTMLRKVL